VGRLPDRGVVHAQVVADRAHHDLARVEPDANLHLDALRPSQAGRVLPDGVLHAQGGIACAHGVILVGQRRAEQRHDAVAHDLVHRALVAVDGLHHVLEDRIENLARLLRIAVGEQLHRALEVGEQHGHLLPLALERGLGRQDAFGEVPRRVGLRPAEAGLRGLVERCRALPAELVPGRVTGSARGAGGGQRGRALAAEARVGGIVGPAAGTHHTGRQSP